MKKLIVALAFLSFASLSEAGTLKQEGSCSGTLPDQSPIIFTYYSDFNGCTDKSKAAVSFSTGQGSLHTGFRELKNSKDIYSFKGKELEQLKIVLDDSTGNTSADITMIDDLDGQANTVSVQCEVRDYEYAECGE